MGKGEMWESAVASPDARAPHPIKGQQPLETPSLNIYPSMYYIYEIRLLA